MFHKPALALLAGLLAVGIWSNASGQGPTTCPTRPLGTSDNSCASTAFVQTAISQQGVRSVSNADGTLTITPVVGNAVASLALSHANTWTGAQSFTPNGLIVNGATPGGVKINAPGIADSATATLWAGSDTFVGVSTPQALTNKTYNGVTVSPSSATLVTTNSATYIFPTASATLAGFIARGTLALGTTAISSATCAGAKAASAVGTVTTDTVNIGFNGDPTAVTGYVPATTGMLTIIPYPSVDNINVKVCNNTASTITPGALTLNWWIGR